MENLEKISKGHLDLQYSPSKWSTRMCSCKVLQEHINFVRQESQLARELIPCELNIPYGPSAAEKLDIIGTDLPETAPICIFIHGGFWMAMSKNESTFPALALHAIGIKCIIVEYALCPAVSLATITEQIRRAFEYAAHYARIHKSRCIDLLGHSAGAHLVAYLLGDLTKLDDYKLLRKIVLVSGIYDLRPLTQTYLNEQLKLTDEEANDLSPLLKTFTQIENAKENLKVYIVIAENDSPVFHTESAQFYGKLQDDGATCTFVTDQGRDHFDIMHAIVPNPDDNQATSSSSSSSSCIVNIFKEEN